MHIDLSGQTVLVTGGSRGIGAAVVRHLSASGARVAIHYHRQADAADALVAEVGNGACAFRGDLADPEECNRIWQEVIEKFGHINAIVNNAGIAISSPLDAPLVNWMQDWNQTLSVNLTAAAVLSRFAIDHFLVHGGGRIVCIASRAAFRGDQPDYFAYAASKAGLVALTRSIARGFGKMGVKAFTLAPGFTRTDMAQSFIDQFGENYAAGDIALDRLTEPDDIAPTVVFLLSGFADHATGTTIDLNAGSYIR